MKTARILLRVSSNQQLEADGDLSVQRAIVKEYVKKNPDWQLDQKEYFEGGVSGYKNSVKDRNALQEALKDAEKGEYDILVAYADDRIGRRLWEIGSYIMSLKGLGVDIYTVKDGCISPASDDICGQIMLSMRFGMAQKSSADTARRVKDTAQKLVQQGKFMGGKAPFGYHLELSGEISKHGRALKHLVVAPEQAEVVRHIYDLSMNLEYGSSKIAQLLNEDENYKRLAPNEYWKGGTITSILTNPIYAGHTAYKRRERVNGKYKTLDSKDWIISTEANEDIVIIDKGTWERVQEKRRRRSEKYTTSLESGDVTVIKRNDGILPLIDVLHCGYCGCKMTNGSKYNYWTIKGTGEKRSSKIGVYRCQNQRQGVPHEQNWQFRADQIEEIVFERIARYIGQLQTKEDIFQQIVSNKDIERKQKEKELDSERKNLRKYQKDIEILKDQIPDAITGSCPFSVDDLASQIHKREEQLQEQKKLIEQKEVELTECSVFLKDWEDVRSKIPSWQKILKDTDKEAKRVLVDRLIERIDITQKKVKIRFKINLSDLFPQPRETIPFGVQEPGIRFYDHILHCVRP